MWKVPECAVNQGYCKSYSERPKREIGIKLQIHYLSMRMRHGDLDQRINVRTLHMIFKNIYCLLCSCLNSQTSTSLLSDGVFSSPFLLHWVLILRIRSLQLDVVKVTVRIGGAKSCGVVLCRPGSCCLLLFSRRFCLITMTANPIIIINAATLIQSAVVLSAIL